MSKTKVGYWVVFDENPDPEEPPEGFFVDFKRAETFSEERRFLKNHLVPVYILHDEQMT